MRLFWKFVFIEALPPQFLLETKRFASIDDSSRVSAVCDLLSSEKVRKKFPQISFFERFSVEKDGFFAVFSWGRMVFETYAYPFGYFLALYIVKLMKF